MIQKDREAILRTVELLQQALAENQDVAVTVGRSNPGVRYYVIGNITGPQMEHSCAEVSVMDDILNGGGTPEVVTVTLS